MLNRYTYTPQKGDDMSMNQENRQLSRQDEEVHLEETLAVVRSNVESYGREVAKMQADIDEMLDHYHDNDAEVYIILNNTITLCDHMKRALVRNEKALGKPYFGRIVFWDEALGREENIYIGRGGIARDSIHQMVIDWRAPVANAYYENGLGKCSYPAPGGGQVRIDLKLKRTYEIEDGKLLDFYDTEVVANDNLLTKYLARNKQAVLGEIIATIQKEQNDIIRKSPYHSLIVQGVAGSGKTTVAMHRISYILYNYQERFKPDDFYIVGSNRILLNYITGVLPDLDVYGIRQMTMEQLFVRLLYEDWDEKKYRILSADQMSRQSAVKGTLGWFHDLEDFCRRLERETIPVGSVLLDQRQFTEEIINGRTIVTDKTGKKPPRPGEVTELLSGGAILDYLRQNPSVSIQSKINMLNERLLLKIHDEFLGKEISYTETRRKAILSAYRGKFGPKAFKKSIFRLYQDFLIGQQVKGYPVEIPETAFDVYDLAALAYLYKRVKETEIISEAHHVVIDEAQDFGMMAYSVLDFCIKDCTYTIMGDVSQNIHFGYGLNDWEELKELILTDEMATFGILKKSYRNTVEISEFATNILHHGQFSGYPVEPIIRHGDPVRLVETEAGKEMFRTAARILKGWQKKGLDTMAVVCRDRKSADLAAKELGNYIAVLENDLEKAVFGSGILVLPVEYTKGLEFDAVLILNPTRQEYPVDDGHAKLLYVAATRALHELCVLHAGNLTGLIADPLPERPPKPREIVGTEAEGIAARMPDSEKPLPRKRISIVQGQDPPSPETKPAKTIPRKKVTATLAPPRTKEPPSRTLLLSRPRGASPGTAPKPPRPPAYPAKPARPDRNLPQTNLSGGNSPRADLQGANFRKTAPPKAGTPGFAFGDMPATEILRPWGHSRIDLSVRWVDKQAEGLIIRSRYGLLRLSPIRDSIVRVSFARGQDLPAGTNPRIALKDVDRTWMYREPGGSSGGFVELLTDELCLRVSKATGAISYFTRDKKLLLGEREKESRQIEELAAGKSRMWLFLNWQKGENLYGVGGQGQGGLPLRGKALYISHNSPGQKLPFLLSDMGYGILMATGHPAICCDIPAYGSYLYTENEAMMDYYFIAGKHQKEILEGYERLCGPVID